MALARPRSWGGDRWGFFAPEQPLVANPGIIRSSSQALAAESQPTRRPSSPLFVLRPRSQSHLLLDVGSRRPPALTQNARPLPPPPRQPVRLPPPPPRPPPK